MLSKFKHLQAFTLIELLLVLLLTGILFGLAIPSYQHFITRVRLIAAVDQLVHAIAVTRNEAIQRKQVVTLCQSPKGTTCSDNWNKGWIVFVDPTRHGQVEKAKNILYYFNALPANVQIRWGGSRSKNYLQYAPSGRTNGQDGTFFLSSQQLVYRIIVSQTGRVRLAKP